MPYGDGGRPGGGPWLHAAFAMLAMLGAGATIGGVVTHHPTPGEAEEIERCQPVVWHEDTDLRGWNLLREQGYVPRDDDRMEALYPPNCEGIEPMTTRQQEIVAAVQPAIDRYLARLAEHERYALSGEVLTMCRCGWEAPYPARSKSANRSLGQHIRYARRDAERLWKIESDELLRRMP